MLKIKEKEIQRTIIDYLRIKNYFFWRNQTVGIYKKSTGSYIPAMAENLGSPDIFVLYHGLLCGLEIKSKKGHQTEHQKAFEQKMQKNGGLYFIIRSFEDILQVEKIVK